MKTARKPSEPDVRLNPSSGALASMWSRSPLNPEANVYFIKSSSVRGLFSGEAETLIPLPDRSEIRRNAVPLSNGASQGFDSNRSEIGIRKLLARTPGMIADLKRQRTYSENLPDFY
jgi:hypothetical protein